MPKMSRVEITLNKERGWGRKLFSRTVLTVRGSPILQLDVSNDGVTLLVRNITMSLICRNIQMRILLVIF